MAKFNKQGTLKEGYVPIYYKGSFTNVLLESTINTMKNLHSFCTCNSFPSGRVSKLQGGYYFLTNENTWEFIGRALDSITFKILFEKFSHYDIKKAQSSS